MNAGRRRPGALEQSITAAVRAAGATGATVEDLRAAIDPSLAYTTLMTTLIRLVGKKVLARSRDGRTYRYTLAEGAASVVAATTAQRMHGLLDRSTDRSGALASFVAGLSVSDEARLIALLDDLHDDEVGGDEAPGESQPR